jgi:hypothetical protein
MMRALQFSLLGLAVAAAIAISVLVLVRNFSTEQAQQAATREVAAQEKVAPAAAPPAEDAPAKETVAEAFAPPPESPAPVAPFIANPVGSQRSAYEPLIVPPSGASGESITVVSREPESPAKSNDSPAAGRLTLSPSQEERVRYVLQSHNIIQSEATDVPLRPGSVLPKEVTLSPMPIELANVVPNYRSYSYVFMQDRIVIVATNSREIGLILPF